MLVYTYQAALLCEDCGEKVREKLTDEKKAPEDPSDERSYDSGDFPKGSDEEGESDSPSHCDHCSAFLESLLTDVGANYVLETAERVLRGEEEDEGTALTEWIDHYEGSDDRITLTALAESGLTIREILGALRKKSEEIARLKAAIKALPTEPVLNNAVAVRAAFTKIRANKTVKVALGRLLDNVVDLLDALENV